MDAQKIWNDSALIEVQVVKIENELRFLVIGYIFTKCWTAVITYRKKNIRIISVRRSRISEVKLYES